MRNLLFFLFLISPLAAQNAEPTNNPSGNISLHVFGLLEQGPTAVADTGAALDQLQREHVAGIFRLLRAGELFAAGPLQDDGTIRGLLIFRTDSLEQARELFTDDPFIKRGYLSLVLHPWWTETAPFHPLNTEDQFESYLFCVLRKGPSWTPGETEGTRRIQEGHMANILRMARLGKLVVAGPFGDDGDWRGVFVFKGTTEEEARQLTAADPAVQTKRLVLDMHG